MSDTDLAHLLQPISEDAPCGEDLEYDPEYQEMERAAQGKPETQFSEAAPPDWRDVQKRALKILQRTHDLRPLVLLARSALKQNNWVLFGNCIELMPHWLEYYWDQVHPQIDPSDQDPEFRVNSIATLSQEATQFNDDTFIRDVRETPLVSSASIGQFSLRDYEIAHGKLQVNLPKDEEPPTEASISAAFADCPSEQIQNTASAITIASDSIHKIDAILTDKLGASQAPDLSAILRELDHANTVVQEALEARGLGVNADSNDSAPAENDVPEEAPTDMSAASSTTTSSASNQSLSGSINSRADVVRALDMICDYYRRNEPSSPIPLLLERAKRLASKSFFEILQDLAPGAIPELDALRGQSGSNQADS